MGSASNVTSGGGGGGGEDSDLQQRLLPPSQQHPPGYLLAFGDTHCLDDSHRTPDNTCFWLITKLLARITAQKKPEDFGFGTHIFAAEQVRPMDVQQFLPYALPPPFTKCA